MNNPGGKICCPLPGCVGEIVWYKNWDISVAGKCYVCKANFTLVLTKGPEMEDREINEEPSLIS